MLDAVRPRLVLIASPAAGPTEIAMVAAERLRRRSMRAILVAEPAAAQERLEALRLGFDDALPDTIAGFELFGRAELLVRRTSHLGQLIEVGDDLELDLGAQALWRRGVAVHLRPKEYRLLALLATHPGRVFTRRQLLDRVWGPGHASDTRTVDVHVRWLRSKVETDPEHPAHLLTVRGTGYRLDPP